MQCPGALHIGHEHAAPGQERRILPSQDMPADDPMAAVRARSSRLVGRRAYG
jgi:hypothetical protein